MADNQELRKLTEARALSSFANPQRSRILDVLGVDGPSTASAIAHRIGLAVGSVSHHLKVLHEATLVEQAPELARDRRERWWRLASTSTRWSRSDFAGDPSAVSASLAAASLAAESLTLQRQFERARDWMARSEQSNPPDSAFATQTWLRLSPDEVAQFNDDLVALARACRQRTDNTDDGVERQTVFLRPRFPGRAVTNGT